MKRVWGLFLIFLIGLMCLSGCDSADEGDAASREQRCLVQQVLDVPEGTEYISDIAVGEENQIFAAVCADGDQILYKYEIENGIWNEQYSVTEILNQAGMSEEDGMEFVTSVSAVGEVFVIANRWDAALTGVEETHFYLICDGVLQEVSAESMDIVYKAQFTGTDALVLEDVSGNLYCFSKAEKKVTGTYYTSAENGYSDQYYVKGDQLCVLCAGEMRVYDLESCEELEASERELSFAGQFSEGNDMDMGAAVKILENEKAIYVFGRDGILEYSGSEGETLISGDDTPQSYDTLTLRNFCSIENGGFLANFDVGMPKLCMYSWAEAGEAAEKEEISIYVLHDTDQWNQLIAFYQEKHPELKIRVQAGIDENFSTTETEALKKLNTALANGEGPDIICFDGIEAENYLAQLCDLSEITEKYSAECLENIVNAYAREDGSVFVVPTQFSAIGIMDEHVLAEDADGWEALQEIDGTEGIRMPAECSRNVINLLCRMFVARQDDTDISESELKEFYRLLDISYMSCGDSALLKAEKVFGTDTDMNAFELNELMPDIETETNLKIFYMSSTNAWRRLLSLCSDSNWQYRTLQEGENYYFAASSLLGVCSGSENQEEALDFVNFALSEEGQQMAGGAALPVNLSVLRESMDQDGISSYYLTDENGADQEWKLISLNSEQKEEFIRMLQTLNRPISNDSLLVSLIQDTFLQYAQGKMTLDEAAEAAAQKLKLYQMEN